MLVKSVELELVRLTGPPARIPGSDGRTGDPTSWVVETVELEVSDRRLTGCGGRRFVI
jgi:hypothetical protein